VNAISLEMAQPPDASESRYGRGLLRQMDRVFGGSRVKVESKRLEFLLLGGQPLRLIDGRGQCILCTSGCGWVTASGVADDILLNRGDAWRISTNGLVLIEAIERATVALIRR
jgi:hypothetical protein